MAGGAGRRGFDTEGHCVVLPNRQDRHVACYRREKGAVPSSGFGLQMAGRAGHRGFDTEGHCVVLQDK